MSDRSEIRDIEISKAPARFKSKAWEVFGFPVLYIDDVRKIDQNNTVCKLCYTKIRYTGNTTNMMNHIQRHHPSLTPLKSTPAKRSATITSNTNRELPTNNSPKNNVNVGGEVEMAFVGQMTGKGRDIDSQQAPMVGQLRMQSFLMPLPPNSTRSQQITESVGVFIAADMRPYSVVQNFGFKRMIKTLEPRYKIPSRTHMANNVIPRIYSKTKNNVVEKLNKASSIAITTDGWTSRNTTSFITITAHFVTDEWTIENPVLQTRSYEESHTSSNLATVLNTAIEEWNLRRSCSKVPVTTDNAINIVNAVRDSPLLGPNVRCFAHTINLASQKALEVTAVDRLLSKVRKLVSFFHRSSTGSTTLENKQKLLDLPEHKLIMDVTTRWNSSYAMLERYQEQHEAVFLTSIETRKKNKELIIPTNEDMINIAAIIQILRVLKMVTTLLCTENNPTVSLILPMKAKITSSMGEDISDNKIISDMKTEVLKSLSPRYTNDIELMEFLEEATLLDPRFRQFSLGFDPDVVFSRIEVKCLELLNKAQENNGEVIELVNEQDNDEPLQKKSRSAIEELLEDFFTEDNTSVTNKNRDCTNPVAEEIRSYRSGDNISLNANPLEWWRINSAQFTHLSNIVKQYIAVPATSVPSERVFSTAGDIVSAQRNCIGSDNVDMLVFLKKNIENDLI